MKAVKAVARATTAVVALEDGIAKTALRAEETLKTAQRKANAARLRLTVTAFTFSAIIAIASLPLMLGVVHDVEGVCVWGNVGTGGVLFAMLIMPLGLLPNDRTLINMMATFLFVVYMIIALVCLNVALGIKEEADQVDDYLRNWDHYGMNATSLPFLAENRSILVSLGISLFTFVAIFLVMLIAMVPLLCSRRSCYPLAPRAALDRTWLVLRIGLSSMHLLFMIATLLRLFYQPDHYLVGCEFGSFSSDIVHGASWGVLPLLATPAVRRRVQSALMRLTSDAHAKEAATVTQLVGGLGIDRALSLARQRFRVIHFSELGELDFASSQDTGCYARAVKAALGECDAFMSHSWSDSWTQKWQTLSEWAADFASGTKRAPSLWLDKACIDQKRMTDPAHVVESLAVLPIYLSGCKALLVFAGSTYTQRLWCILELFTFLRMGAERSAITLLPLAASDGVGLDEGETGALVHEQRSMAATLAAFARFDVRQTRCTVQTDQDRLLTVIESGFGDHTTFNALVRRTFTESNLDDEASAAAAVEQGGETAENKIHVWRGQTQRRKLTMSRVAPSASHAAPLGIVPQPQCSRHDDGVEAVERRSPDDADA